VKKHSVASTYFYKFRCDFWEKEKIWVQASRCASFGGFEPFFGVFVVLEITGPVYGLVRLISIVETLDFLFSSALCISSVPMLMPCSSRSFTKARRNSSTVSTALLIARPLAFTVTCFSPELKKVRHATT
jgi:hypothetical protein